MSGRMKDTATSSLTKGNWPTGKRIIFAAAETENNIGEFKGTLSDLLKVQARWKIAAFYESPDLEARQREIVQVYEYFKDSGFIEADGTQYLVMFGPPGIKPDRGIRSVARYRVWT